MKSLISRRFRIGQKVITKSGLIATVIGSVLYGVFDNKPTPFTYVCYRLQTQGHKRTFYRNECELQAGD
jgi:hypothetical protein